jgi:hypothetical protein
MDKLIDIWRFDLRKGPSRDTRTMACLMDAVSWFSYDRLGDAPECVSPAIASYCRTINDIMSHKDRQRLKLCIPRLIDCVDPSAEVARSESLARSALGVFAPAALDKAGRHLQASHLRDLAKKHDLYEAIFYANKICGPTDPNGIIDRFVSNLKMLSPSYRRDWNANKTLEQAVRSGYYPQNAIISGDIHPFILKSISMETTRTGLYAGLSAYGGASTENIIMALDAALSLGRQGGDLLPDHISTANRRFSIASASS